MLAPNPDFYKLFVEVLGKETGFSRGMGVRCTCMISLTVFMAQLLLLREPFLSVGAGLAAKMQSINVPDIGVAYIGDGAVKKALSMSSTASTLNIPVLFIVENIYLATCTYLNVNL